MKKNGFKLLISLIVVVVGLFIYTQFNQKTTEKDIDIEVNLVIYDGNNLVFEATLDSKEDQSVETFLRTYFTLKGSNFGFGYFLTGIQSNEVDLEVDNTTYFAFYVDDIYQEKGISQTYLKDGQTVLLKLEALR
ncbi:MAG TPA: hypothetical protein DEA45_04100 [Acholeplasmataceae bacterium]|nr:hypothetical protein [Acholeplasmataceae bacterium]